MRCRHAAPRDARWRYIPHRRASGGGGSESLRALFAGVWQAFNCRRRPFNPRIMQAEGVRPTKSTHRLCTPGHIAMVRRACSHHSPTCRRMYSRRAWPRTSRGLLVPTGCGVAARDAQRAGAASQKLAHGRRALGALWLGRDSSANLGHSKQKLASGSCVAARALAHVVRCFRGPSFLCRLSGMSATLPVSRLFASLLPLLLAFSLPSFLPNPICQTF